MPANAIVSAYEPLASAANLLGLSSLHISSTMAPVVGAAKVDAQIALVPANGWGQREGPVEARPILDRPGDTMVAVRVGLASVSVGSYPYMHPPAKRGKVVRLTEASRSRMVRYLEDAEARYQYMATLTVGAEWSRDGAAFKTALDRWLCWFQGEQVKGSSDPGAESAFWFLEFQKRGAPHVHVFYTRRVPWQLAAAKWAQCLGDETVELTGTRFESLAKGQNVKPHRMRGRLCAYARKYAHKVEQKLVPEDYRNVGRFWGVRGCRRMVTLRVSTSHTEARGGLLLANMEHVLERAHELGYLRKLSWSHGDGAIYFALRGATLWDIYLEDDDRRTGKSLGWLVDRMIVDYLLDRRAA